VWHSTAQHVIARHGAAVKRNTTQHSTVNHGMSRLSVLQRSTARRSAAQHGTARHTTAQQGTAWRCIASQHGPRPHLQGSSCTPQHSTAHHLPTSTLQGMSCTSQHSTPPTHVHPARHVMHIAAQLTTHPPPPCKACHAHRSTAHHPPTSTLQGMLGHTPLSTPLQRHWIVLLAACV
jgi:hypothetical protein